MTLVNICAFPLKEIMMSYAVRHEAEAGVTHLISGASPCKTSMNLLKKVSSQINITSWTSHHALHFMFINYALCVDWLARKKRGKAISFRWGNWALPHLYAKKVLILWRGLKIELLNYLRHFKYQWPTWIWNLSWLTMQDCICNSLFCNVPFREKMMPFDWYKHEYEPNKKEQ